MPELSVANVKIHIEVPLFLMFFAFTLEGPISTNFIIYRTCYITLGFNESECALLGTNTTDNATAILEQKVQPYAAVLSMTRLISVTFIPCLLCFFIGPWSDKYGRKPVLLSGLAGLTVSYLIVTAVSAVRNASPWFLLFTVLPICISGGFPALLTVMFSYVSDVTNPDNMGIRMGFLEAFLTAGTIAGTLSSSFILKKLGYTVVYAICTLSTFLAGAFTLFLIPESIQTLETRKWANLFQWSLMKETFTTTFKRRENRGRPLLLCLLSVMILFTMTYLGDQSVKFLYLRAKFHWSLEFFTYYATATNVMWILGNVAGTYLLNKLLHVRETMVIISGLLSVGIGCIVLGLATNNWYIYTAGCISSLGGAVSPMARSLLAKLVSVEDSGKVFSLISAMQCSGGVISSPIYTFLYNSTLLTSPGSYNFLMACIFALCIFITIAMIIIKRKQTIEYDQHIDDTVDVEPNNSITS